MNIHLKWITLHQIVFNTICDIIFLHQTILLSVLSCTNQSWQSAIPSQSSAAWPWKVDDEGTAPTNFSYNSRPTFFNFQALACFLFYPLHILCALVCIFSPYMNGEDGESCLTLPVLGWFCLLRFCGWLLSWSPAPRSTWPWRHSLTHQDVQRRAAHLPSPSQEPETLLEREHRSARERPRPTSTKRDRLGASVGRVE